MEASGVALDIGKHRGAGSRERCILFQIMALTNFKQDFTVFRHVYLYHSSNSSSSAAGAGWLRLLTYSQFSIEFHFDIK